ncbi:MAG: dTDP-4-amino-4,6-dideoxygalactose transaminase [Clostridia bacterium]|nr:dTDP-4-amino-4,6-dideoxygalactose transaminase [Clostridia bacterium]
MIPFTKTSITDVEKNYINEAISNNKICGDGKFTKKCNEWFKENCNINNFLLTTSGTHSLELAALLAELKEGDEVLVPSYTFVSTADAILLRGATPVFIDIDKRTFNMDVELIEEKITPKTKAIFPVHYAGVACDMDKIMEIAKKHNLIVVEDAAQAVLAYYKGRPLGTIGDYGCYSFHETKNYVMGEGGAIIVKDDKKFEEAEIIREKGTNRSQFIRGDVDKYTWHKIGSSYLPSDILVALLYGQLTRADEIMEKRMAIWNIYNNELGELEKQGKLIRPYIPEYAKHNAHMYYIVLPTEEIRNNLMDKLKEHGISATFHYIPLHTSPMGIKLGCKAGDLPVTEEYARRLLRLPLFADMNEEEAEYVCNTIKDIL